MRNSQMRLEEPKEGFRKTTKVLYICPSNLLLLLNSEDGLKTETANQIERILSKGKIKQSEKNQFWFCSNGNEYKYLSNAYLKYSQYAAALYLINESQRESFEDIFKKSLSQSKSLLCDLYTIKPTSQEHLWCYALPVQSSVDHKGNKTYSPNISPEITEQTIDSYSFLLPIEDATNIKLDNSQIIGVDLMSRTNTQNVSGSSDYF